MAAQKGRSFLLKIGDGATPVEGFTTVGGQRTTGMTIAGEQVDVSDKSSRWRELMEDAGIVSMSVNCAGVFKDTATERSMLDKALDQTVDNYQLVFEDGDVFEGPFQIASLEYTGEYNGARMYTAQLESAGTVTYDEVT